MRLKERLSDFQWYPLVREGNRIELVGGYFERFMPEFQEQPPTPFFQGKRSLSKLSSRIRRGNIAYINDLGMPLYG
jgi:hypothetical protein